MVATTGINSGSGLDVQSMVHGLVQVKRAPDQQNINTRRTEITSEISAFGRVRTAVDDLQQSVKDLSKPDNYSQHTVSDTGQELFTAEASAKAAPGDFNIEVLQLATSHKLISAAVSDRKDIGSGKLTFSQDSEDSSFTVELMDNPLGNSLDDLAQMINSHKDNKGIVAGIIQDEDGAHLVFSSSEKGTESHITIQSAQAKSDLGKFDTDSLSMKTLSSGQDAMISIDGLKAVNSGNTFSDTVKGVDITVLKTSEKNQDGSLISDELKIETDRSNVKDLVQSFVDSYNKLISTVNSESRHDDASDSDGALRGNTVLSAGSRQVRNALNQSIGDPQAQGTIKNLSELGITTTIDGDLTLDSEILDKQIANNYQAVKSFFVGKDGFAKKFSEKVGIFSETGGAIDTANNSLIEEQRSLDTKQLDLDRKVDAYEERLTKQYSALDKSINELTSQLGYMQGVIG